MMDNTEILVSADLMGVWSNLLQFSAKKLQTVRYISQPHHYNIPYTVFIGIDIIFKM